MAVQFMKLGEEAQPLNDTAVIVAMHGGRHRQTFVVVMPGQVQRQRVLVAGGNRQVKTEENNISGDAAPQLSPCVGCWS